MAETNDLTTLTAEIAASFVSNNHVAVGDIAGVITSVYATLSGLGQPVEAEGSAFEPAVSVRKSLADPTKIVSMINGKPYSTLKRHLGAHGLTPAHYRERYKLPASYPMVAPAYSEARKAMAKKVGLGRKPGQKPAPKNPVGRPKGIAAAKKAAIAHLGGGTAE